MSEKQETKVVEKPSKKAKDINPRIAEIRKELAQLHKKRLDYANYMNQLDVVGAKAKRGFENMKRITFTQENALKAELSKIEGDK